MPRWPALLAPAVALSLAATPRIGEEIELEEAKVFVEFNSTDMDFGIQFFWDGEAWKTMRVEGPDGHTVLKVSAKRNLRQHGLTEGFFESAEPPASVLSMAQFFDRFPAGTYEFEGETLEGNDLVGETEFTHTLPAPPTNLFPPAGAVLNALNPLVASFDAVTQDLAGNPLVPELYELIVEADHPTLGEISFTVVLEGGVANPSATVPPEFLHPGMEYKLEVIAQVEGGNRTISEVSWTTAP
ncbi:MAG: hypothetical protein L0323_14330 [Planctomycetes bacterium]|nr:hypothetical protein [Planctomycetota bacterium]